MESRDLTWSPAEGWSSDLPDLDSPDTCVIAFGDAGFDGDCPALRDLAARYPSSHLLGCSTSGEIAAGRVVDGTVSVGIGRFERSRLRSAQARIDDPSGSRTAGERLARELVADDLRALFVLSDGLGVNGSELVRGVNSVVSEDVVVTGGLAGDGDRFERTWVVTRTGIGSGVVAAVAFYGADVLTACGSRGGWDIFGPERRVTRAEGNVLYELDDQPALTLYKRYLGEQARELPAAALRFPLAVRHRDDGRTVVRTVLSVDEAARSMTFAGDVPVGSQARLMCANRDRLIDGAASAAHGLDEAVRQSGSGALVFAVSCVGRRIVLGERTDEEIEVITERIPPGAALLGFYSYGEICPHGGGRCDLHNQTMTLTVIGER